MTINYVQVYLTGCLYKNSDGGKFKSSRVPMFMFRCTISQPVKLMEVNKIVLLTLEKQLSVKMLNQHRCAVM